MTRLLRPLIAQTTWRRWSYVIVGGALMIPYGIEAMFVTAAYNESGHEGLQSAIFALAFLVPMLLTVLVPTVRFIEGTAARELLAAPRGIGAARPMPEWARVACWYTAHLLVGGVMPIFIVTVLAAMFTAVVSPFLDRLGAY